MLPSDSQNNHNSQSMATRSHSRHSLENFSYVLKVCGELDLKLPVNSEYSSFMFNEMKTLVNLVHITRMKQVQF